MNPIHTLRRAAGILAGLAAAALAALTAAPAALATTSPGPPGSAGSAPQHLPPLPPGWYKHPPLPAPIHTTVTGGMPGWQITLTAAGAVLAVAALAVLLNRALAARRHTAARST